MAEDNGSVESNVREVKSGDEALNKLCDEDEEDSDRLECAVCLQPCIHPVQLPCGHIFCYLCVKGVANQSKRCAMCRKELPSGYLEHPNLLNASDLTDVSACAFDDGRLWFYEGHNGWWQYDERTSAELEAAFTGGNRVCELLIAGFLYVIDFNGMAQYRRNDPSRRRRIKRDMATIAKKGIAGLRLHHSSADESENDEQQLTGETADASSGVDDDSVSSATTNTTTTTTTTTPPSSHRRRRRPGARRSQFEARAADRDSDGAEGSEEDSPLVAPAVLPRVGLSPAPPPSVPTTMATAAAPVLSSRQGAVVSPAPSAPNNTPQTPHTPSQDSGTSSPVASSGAPDPGLNEIVQGMENLLGAIRSDTYSSSDDSDGDEFYVNLHARHDAH